MYVSRVRAAMGRCEQVGQWVVYRSVFHHQAVLPNHLEAPRAARLTETASISTSPKTSSTLLSCEASAPSMVCEPCCSKASSAVSTKSSSTVLAALVAMPSNDLGVAALPCRMVDTFAYIAVPHPALDGDPANRDVVETAEQVAPEFNSVRVVGWALDVHIEESDLRCSLAEGDVGD